MKNKNENVNVEMVGDGPVNIKFTQYILGMFRFGRQIVVSPKANAFFNKVGYSVKYYVDSVSVTIGIGKDHTAELTMTKEAWNALKAGDEVHISTTQEFKKKFKL